MKIIMLMLMLALALLPGYAAGNDFGSLSAGELKAKLDRREEGLVIVDSRSAREHEQLRIKGAVSLPLSVMESDPGLPKLPKDALLVFYCSGST